MAYLSSSSTLAARSAVGLGAWIALSLAVVLAVAVVAFVRVGGKPVAGVGPDVVYRRGGARADGHCVAGAVFDAGGGGRLARTPRPTIRRARRARPTMSEFFGRNGIGIGPEAATVLLRIQFCGGVDGIGIEALVVMREAVAEHLKVYVGGAEPYRAEDASVLVFRFPRYGNVLAEDVIGEPLLALLPERLILLRRVDSVKPDFMLDGGSIGGGKQSDRVAVDDTNDPPPHLVGEKRE